MKPADFSSYPEQMNKAFRDFWVNSLWEPLMDKTQSLCSVFQPSHPSFCSNFLIFFSFLLLPPTHVSFPCPCLHCVPLLHPQSSLHTCTESPTPTQHLCCHAVFQINVEILTSNEAGRRKSSGGRSRNGWNVTQPNCIWCYTATYLAVDTSWKPHCLIYDRFTFIPLNFWVVTVECKQPQG